tara:strand:- start:236 stop:475 length:240 start_codon:yes stop_codon:yes gene_type:complete
MGRIFIEETIKNTGINRNNLVVICTYLVRSKQAKNVGDAIRKLEKGEFDGVDLQEEMIEAHRKVHEQTFEEPPEDIDAI